MNSGARDEVSSAIKRRLGALGCAFSLVLCLWLVKPWLQMGTIDDVSYTRSAQMLAQTGHIVYNGWATAMLGWQLFLGAAFIKIFGFSFNVTRLSILPVAMATAFLSQRSMVRAGLTERNATLATLTLVLSPMFLPLAFSYMTDIPGLLVVVLCFYGCLRALQANTDRSTCLWLAFTAISNALGGSVRQIAWLGLLLMIPATLWLLRRRRSVLVWGCVSVLCGLGIMLATMTWFKHQPGAVHESVWLGHLSRNRGRDTVVEMTRLLFDAPVFLLPVLLPFIPAVAWKDRSARSAFLWSIAILAAGLLLIHHEPAFWLEPCMRDYVTKFGVMNGSAINGPRPVILSAGVRVVLTVLVMAGIGAIASVIRKVRTQTDGREDTSSNTLSWSSLFVLVAPFSVGYIALLISRAGLFMIFDRYLLALLFFLILLVTRLYQERISLRFPLYSYVLLGIVALYAVGVTHDAFAMFRARLQAVRQLQTRGVPDVEIDGGFEPNMWAALNAGRMLKVDEGAAGTALKNYHPDPDLLCKPELAPNLGLLHPRYALSFDPNACGGLVGFAPVHYREWFGPRQVNIYIVSSRKQSNADAGIEH